MFYEYKISRDHIKCVCQTCKSEVGFREQCFLCGEINWSDEVLDRFADRQTVKGEMMTVSCTTRRIDWTEVKVDNRITFGVYPTSFRFM